MVSAQGGKKNTSNAWSVFMGIFESFASNCANYLGINIKSTGCLAQIASNFQGRPSNFQGIHACDEIRKAMPWPVLSQMCIVHRYTERPQACGFGNFTHICILKNVVLEDHWIFFQRRGNFSIGLMAKYLLTAGTLSVVGPVGTSTLWERFL